MIRFHDSATSLLKECDTLIVIAPEARLRDGTAQKAVPGHHWGVLVEPMKEPKSGTKGVAYSSYTGVAHPRQIIVVSLPDTVSRGNTATRKEWIYAHTAAIEANAKPGVVILLDKAEHYFAAAAAIARRIRPFNRKSAGRKTQKIHVAAFVKTKIVPANEKIEAVVKAIEWTCRLIDSPPSEMDPEQLAMEFKKSVKGIPHVTVKEIVGDKLLDEQLGGLHAVGRGASVPARMLIMEYKPPKAKKTVALIGKGVTFDTGGLNLKISGSMIGMKMDMGGAAAVGGAFQLLARTGCPNRIIATVGLVENAIGPGAYKPDDILKMHSGKTVEINNTDAEGRLVLADCVSYTARKLKPDLIIEAATLTGAQAVATGNLHAGLVTNADDLEAFALGIGKETGDLLAPLPFAPEIFQDEFASSLADMKNSVKNRANAQSSCAATFVYSHIDDLDIPWAHIDLAGPAVCSQNLATGYGVGILSEMARRY